MGEGRDYAAVNNTESDKRDVCETPRAQRQRRSTMSEKRNEVVREGRIGGFFLWMGKVGRERRARGTALEKAGKFRVAAQWSTALLGHCAKNHAAAAAKETVRDCALTDAWGSQAVTTGSPARSQFWSSQVKAPTPSRIYWLAARRTDQDSAPKTSLCCGLSSWAYRRGLGRRRVFGPDLAAAVFLVGGLQRVRRHRRCRRLMGRVARSFCLAHVLLSRARTEGLLRPFSWP